ncbi:aldolase/citrate lyase family protein [Saccharopolyspora terrae]|uniref:aldolase/citrate lyase family protein n=1 Tax=Saccharopolyspora terrae TaxID=2530384 RepID=UPI0038B4B7E4
MERFSNAAAARADLVVLDLEDAVAPIRKAEGRRNVVDWLSGHDAPCAVRAVSAVASALIVAPSVLRRWRSRRGRRGR